MDSREGAGIMGVPPKETQFKPGQSGNPKGRKKGRRNMSTIIKEILDAKLSGKNPITGVEGNLPISEIITYKQVQKALKGDLSAYKELIDRAEGKSMQTQVINANINTEMSQVLDELEDGDTNDDK